MKSAGRSTLACRSVEGRRYQCHHGSAPADLVAGAVGRLWSIYGNIIEIVSTDLGGSSPVRSGFTSGSRGSLAAPPGLGRTCGVGSGGPTRDSGRLLLKIAPAIEDKDIRHLRSIPQFLGVLDDLLRAGLRFAVTLYPQLLPRFSRRLVTLNTIALACDE